MAKQNTMPLTPPHLLVAAQDVADGFGAGQGLVDLHGRAAGVGKQRVHTLALQGLSKGGIKRASEVSAMHNSQRQKWANSVSTPSRSRASQKGATNRQRGGEAGVKSGRQRGGVGAAG